MKKIYTLRANEDWIIDHMVNEWESFPKDLKIVSNPEEADIIWILADFCWQQINKQTLRKKIVVVTIHHIVPEKFTIAAQSEFAQRDEFVDFYHVFNERTYQFLIENCNISSLRIKLIPYWCNDEFWKRDENLDVVKFRQIAGLSKDAFVVFSAQRDTEGYDLKSPKLEKGPDLLADAIIKLQKTKQNLEVFLLGWRRQYLVECLLKAGITPRVGSHKSKNYLEREYVRAAYQISDLYIVASRYEGGPQALLECGLMGLKVISRPVGIAEQVLPPEAINTDVWKATPFIPNVEQLKMKVVFPQYIDFFKSL